MHNPAPGRENDTHKLQSDFHIQTDHLIPARRPDLIIINKNKRICKIVDFAVLADHRINLKECAKKDKSLDHARELKKTVEHESDDRTNCDLRFWHNNKRIIKRPGRLWSWPTGRVYLNESIAENGQNPETSPGDLSIFAVTQTPAKTISYHWCQKL